MLTGLSTLATRRMPPRLGWPCARAARGRASMPAPAPAAAPVSHCRRVSCGPLRSLIVVPPLNRPVLHDEAHTPHRLDVLQRVTVDRDEVGALADRQAADVVLHAARFGA